jgi:hypothetical protein
MIIIIRRRRRRRKSRDDETAAAVVRGHRCWHDNSAMASSHDTTRSSFSVFREQNESERERKEGALVGR